MDYDLGDDAGRLRNHLRELISNHIPADFLGACTDDPQDLATTETFCKLLATEGLLALAWPKEHGGGGGSVWQQTVLREEQARVSAVALVPDLDMAGARGSAIAARAFVLAGG